MPRVVRSTHNDSGGFLAQMLLAMQWVLVFSNSGLPSRYCCDNGIPYPVLGWLIFRSDTPLLPIICSFLPFVPLIHSLTWGAFVDCPHWVRSDHRTRWSHWARKASWLLMLQCSLAGEPVISQIIMWWCMVHLKIDSDTTATVKWRVAAGSPTGKCRWRYIVKDG